MVRKIVVACSGVLIIALSLVVMRLLANQKKRPERKTQMEQVFMSPLLEVNNSSMKTSLSAMGVVEAVNKVEIYAEVGGIMKMTSKNFLEGMSYRGGELMISIDSQEDEMNLKSMKSELLNLIVELLPDLKLDYINSYEQWSEYLKNYNIEGKTEELPSPLSEQEKYFISARGIQQKYYDIKSLEAKLFKYNIYAPFDGELIESNIKPGTLVRTGQKLGEYINSNQFDLVVSLSLEDAKSVKQGSEVDVVSNATGETWSGEVHRVNKSIDEMTQTVKAFVRINGNDLKEGMFLKAEIYTGKTNSGIEIPRKLLLEDNSVFVLENDMATKVKVNVIQQKDDKVIVSGIEDGSKVILKAQGLEVGKPVIGENSSISHS